jgi:hypothetical protein
MPIRHAPVTSASLSRLSGSHIHAHLSDSIHSGAKHITREHPADALRRSSQDNVAGMQSVEGGCQFDQFSNAQDKVVSIGILPNFVVYGDSECKSRRIR